MIFVDHQLRLLRFTPTAAQITNLIQSDLGRPVGHIVSNLIGYDGMVADTQSVLNTLVPIQVEVQTADGTWYMMRIRPYRTLENAIEGAVITFVDITELRQVQDKLRRLTVIVSDAFDAITLQNLDGRILAWNPGAIRMYGWSQDEALLMNVRDRIPEVLQEEELAKLDQLKLGEILEPFQSLRLTQQGTELEVWITATALINEAKHVYAIATTEQALKPNIKLMMQADNARRE
jgi:two-component system CheB/CheR fusion protein